jgi:hypothetical protein
MSETTPHQLLITLVHGTWGRGFFPRRRAKSRRPFWFEGGSPFLARLSAELGDIPHKITPLLWSGANSIFVRDKTARALADNLAAEYATHRQTTQLIIAHSHGGNIALRALHHLRQRRDASQLSEAEGSKPFVVTLATPFIEVHQADFGRRPLYTRVALLFLSVYLVTFPMVFVLDFLEPKLPQLHFSVLFYTWSSVWVFYIVFIVWWGWRWLFRRATARRNRVHELNVTTRLGESGSSQRTLVLRAVDDEASLVLALGTILNYITTLVIGIAFFLLGLSLGVMSWVAEEYFKMAFYPMVFGWIILTIILLCLLMLSRAVHGRELAMSPMECQINTQSTPDAVSLSKIVTLVRRTYIKSLRHGIYDHEDCAKAIADWVRSQHHHMTGAVENNYPYKP